MRVPPAARGPRPHTPPNPTGLHPTLALLFPAPQHQPLLSLCPSTQESAVSTYCVVDTTAEGPQGPSRAVRSDCYLPFPLSSSPKRRAQVSRAAWDMIGPGPRVGYERCSVKPRKTLVNE